MLFKSIKKYITPVFYILLAIFFVLYLRTLDLSKLDFTSINPFYILLSGVFALGFRFWGAYIWIVILRGLGAKEVRLSKPLLFVYAKSWMARYIPGTAPWILSKIYFAAQYNISKNKLAVSSLLEAALQIVSLFALALFALAVDAHTVNLEQNTRILLWVALAGLLVCLYPSVFNFFFSLAYKIVKRKVFPSEHKVDLRTVSVGMGLYLIGSIINGLGMFFIAKAVYGPLPFDTILFIIGSGSLAGALSMLAVFAPSGIGVREGIQLGLLSLIMPAEYALVVVLATRIWDVVIDVIFYGIGVIAQRQDRSNND